MARIDAAPDALVNETHGKENGAVSGALIGARHPVARATLVA